MKLFGYSLIRSGSLDGLYSRLAAIEAALKKHDEDAFRQTQCQISVFSRLETRLKLLEAIHGCRFEPYLGDVLNKSGSGRHVKIDRKTLLGIQASLCRQWRAIAEDKVTYKKWGILK